MGPNSSVVREPIGGKGFFKDSLKDESESWDEASAWLSLKAAIFSPDRCMEAAEAATSANAKRHDILLEKMGGARSFAAVANGSKDHR